MEGIGPPPCIYAPVVSYGSMVKGKHGEIGAPATEPDVTNGEEEADTVASNAVDEKCDSNPHGQSPLEGVVMKTWRKLLNIGTWNDRTLYQPGKLDIFDTRTEPHENRYYGNSRNKMDRYWKTCER